LTAMDSSSAHQLRWVMGAGLLGLTASSLFSSLLHFSRTAFVLEYGVLAAMFLVAYVQLNRIDPVTQVRRRWVGGTIGGVLTGVLLTWSVFSHAASSRPSGACLAGALVWFGVVYGTIDALLLNIMPVLSVYGMRSRETLRPPGRRLRWGLAAWGASLLVTALYHVGFVEFQGPALVQPVLGNALITLSYLLTGNPLAPLIAHVLMHMAAVLHGTETAVQLPPHY
jgi:hypothetical protein